MGDDGFMYYIEITMNFKGALMRKIGSGSPSPDTFDRDEFSSMSYVAIMSNIETVVGVWWIGDVFCCELVPTLLII